MVGGGVVRIRYVAGFPFHIPDEQLPNVLLLLGFEGTSAFFSFPPMEAPSSPMDLLKTEFGINLEPFNELPWNGASSLSSPLALH